MRLRHLFFFIALIIVTILGIIQFGQFQEFANVVKKINILLLLTAILLRFFYYFTNAKFYQKYFKIFRKNINFKKLFSYIITMNFANTVFPSGGMSGAVILRKSLRADGIPAPATTVAVAIWYGFVGIIYILLLLIALFMLFVSNQIAKVSFRLVMVILLLLLLIALFGIAILLNRRLTHRLVYYTTRPLNWILKRFKHDTFSKQQIQDLIEKFYTTLKSFKASWRKLLNPFGWVFFNQILDIASLYIIIVAFGAIPNPGIVVAAYLIALMVSLLSVFTSGVGIYELSMVSALVALGLSFDISFSATVVYRIVALWLFLVVGIYFYKRTMLDGK